MIVFAVETMRQCIEDVRQLCVGHWDEIALDHSCVPLDPDWEKYLTLSDVGIMHIVTARDAGQLVGYHFSVVTPHLHYMSTLHAFTDIYYISPARRSGRTGLRLFQAVERELVKLGVRKWITATKLHLDNSRLLEHIGFRRTEHVYTKMIGA